MPTDPDAAFEHARTVCAGFPGAEIDHPFGDQTDVFKVGGKMFALLSREREPAWFTLKLGPELNEQLRAEHPQTVLPGYYMNKTHWSTFVLGGDPPLAGMDDIDEYAALSYDLVVASLPRRLRPGAS